MRSNSEDPKDTYSFHMKLIALLCFLPAASALGYCNDKDLSCAAWGKAGECVGSNSHVSSESPLSLHTANRPR